MEDVPTALAAGATVVTAGRRQAEHLRLTHDRRQAACGRRAWPTARVLPWGAWLNELWEQQTHRGAGQRLLAAGEARFVWQVIVGRAGGDAVDGTSHVAAARLAWEAWRTCRTWNIERSTLARCADSRDTRTFAQWVEAYEHLCAQRGWIDTATLADVLAATPSAAGDIGERVLVAFGDEASPQQLRLLEQLAARGAPVERSAARGSPAGVVRRHACRDAAAELQAAARWARAIKEQEPLARVGIVVPDLANRGPEVRRLLLDVMVPSWREGPPAEELIDLGRGEALSAHGAVHVALILLDLLHGPIDYRSAGQLLRSPFIGRGQADAAGRVALDLQLRSRVGTRIDAAGLAAQAAASDLALAAGFDRLQARRDDGRRDPGAWALLFSTVLADLGWPGAGEAGDRPRALLDAWQVALDGVAGLDTVLGARTCREAVYLVRAACEDTALPVVVAPDAIQVIGTAEALEGDYGALWVTGMHESAWPPPARPNPLLPLDLQRQAGIPAATPRLARTTAARRFADLLTRAGRVVCSWPVLEGNAEHLPSPFLAGVADLDADAAAAAATVVRQQFDARPAVMRVERDTAPPLRPGRRLAGGTRALSLQAACPARAFFECRLGAAEFPSPEAGLGADARGRVLHAVLRDLFDELPGQEALVALTPADRRVRVAALIGRHLGEALDAADPFQARLLETESELMGVRIATFLEIEQSRAPFEVVHLEADSDGSIGGVGIRVRPDRVDRTADGHLVVLDYKTGSFQRAGWNGPRPREPQLPVYATLLDADAVAAVCIGRGATRWLAQGAPGVDIPGMTARGRKAAPEEWQGTRAGWRTALEGLAAEILAGDCRINRWQRRLAEGEWTMLTRVHALPADDADEAEEEGA